MDKALKMGKKSATGSFKLSFGLISSTVIMAFSTIILGNILSPSELGLYIIALTPPSIFALFRTLGLDFALTRFAAKFQASGDEEKTRASVICGVIFEIAVGVLLSFVSLILASFIASTVLGRPESTFLISLASFSILTNTLLTLSHSIFFGIERMGLSSLITIVNSIIQTTISIFLVLLGYGALGPVIGYTFSPLIVGTIGLIMVYSLLFRNAKKRSKSLDFFNSLKTMLHYGLPLSSTTIIAGFLAQFYIFMMAINFNDVLVGNYKIALNFAVLLTFFTQPVTNVLFPTFARIDPKKEHVLLKTVFSSSVKYVALLLVPATMGLMALSEPIVSVLFQNRYVYASTFLVLYAVGNLFQALGNVSANSLLSGIGETRMQMKQSFLKLFLGIPLVLLLISMFGILGLIAGTWLSGLPSLFWGLYWIHKNYKLKANYNSLLRVFAAASLAAIVSFLSLNLLNASSWMGIIVGGPIFLGCYFLSLPVLNAVDKVEIQNLRSMFSGLGLITKILNIPFNLLERFTVFNQTRGKHEQAIQDVSSNKDSK